jgi:hypothetical protein
VALLLENELDTGSKCALGRPVSGVRNGRERRFDSNAPANPRSTDDLSRAAPKPRTRVPGTHPSARRDSLLSSGVRSLKRGVRTTVRCNSPYHPPSVHTGKVCRSEVV